MGEDYLESEELLNDIAPDVLGVLKHYRFFERLDDIFCPADCSIEPPQCNHSFNRSAEILADIGFDSRKIEEITERVATARCFTTWLRKAA